MRKSKNSILKTVVTMTLLAGAIIGAFIFMSNNIRNSSDSKIPTTEVEKLLAKDLAAGYPGTPEEVIKLYIRINQSFYNQGLKEEELLKMIDQLRLLMDEELLENNPIEVHTASLRVLVKENKDKNRTFMSYIVENNSSVETATIEGTERATIYANYMVKESGKYEKTYLQFILRKDKEEHWKILGWKTVDKDTSTE